MKGGVGSAFARYTLPRVTWAVFVCLLKQMPLSKPLSHSNTYLLEWNRPTSVCGVDIYFHTFLFEEKNFSLLLPFWHEEKLVYSQERGGNVFISKQEYFSPLGSIDSG